MPYLQIIGSVENIGRDKLGNAQVLEHYIMPHHAGSHLASSVGLVINLKGTLSSSTPACSGVPEDLGVFCWVIYISVFYCETAHSDATVPTSLG